MSEDKNIYYVYVHRKLSDNSIFYVGKGCNGRCRSDNPRNLFWWRVVIEENGFAPYIVESNLTEREAFDKELSLIETIGYENLTNITPGEFGKNGLTIPETLSENNQSIPHEATQVGFMSKQKKLWKKRTNLAEKTLPSISEYTFLENYFELDADSFLEVSELKNVTSKIFNENKRLLEKLGIYSPIPATKVAAYFNLIVKNKRVGKESKRCIFGIKIK
jgi:hypothetical protein